MKVGRNDPCPCGSGKKYKKCCMDKMEKNQPGTVTIPNAGQDISRMSEPEQIKHWIDQGYGPMISGRDCTAADVWEKAWTQLMQWAEGKQITSIEQLNKKGFPRMGDEVSNWIPEYDIALANAKRDDEKYVHRRKAFANELLEYFPDSDSSIIEIAITAKGESLFYFGETDGADEVFASYTQEHPNQLWVFVHWADLYNPAFHSHAADKEKSALLYRKALECNAHEADLDVVEERLRTLGE